MLEFLGYIAARVIAGVITALILSVIFNQQCTQVSCRQLLQRLSRLATNHMGGLPFIGDGLVQGASHAFRRSVHHQPAEGAIVDLSCF